MKTVSVGINTAGISHTDPMCLSLSTTTTSDVKTPGRESKGNLSCVLSLLFLQRMACACYLTGVLLFGFVSISTVSREHVADLNVGPPRWHWLSLAPFYSVGYNSRGDGQWAMLDEWLWLIVLVLAFFAMGSHGVRWAFRNAREERALQCYHVVMGLAYVAFVHGPPFYLPLLCVLANYGFVALLVRLRAPRRVFMAAVWATQLGVLVGINYYGKRIEASNASFAVAWWPRRLRWTVGFNMATLRMIAFNMDMYEGVNDGEAQQERAARKHDITCVECARMRGTRGFEESVAMRCYNFRTESPCHPREYNLLSYMAYMLYIPLYIAGPISSFNAFASHCRHPTAVMSRWQIFFYALRIIGIYCILVTMLHFAYLNAFRLRPDIFLALPTFQKAFILYYSLAFLWLKFSLVWKLSRLGAIVDGVDVPEDMRRCFSNTVSVRDFWRDWHASFNLWIVRYMYIPLGGNKKRHLNIFLVFFFIAIWHDVALHLVKWAACIVVTFLLELRVTSIWNSPRFAHLRISPYQHILRCIGALFSTFGLIVANLIGFSSQANTHDGRQTDSAIADALTSAGPYFYVKLLLFLLCVASLCIAERDAKAAELSRLKRKYGLL